MLHVLITSYSRCPVGGTEQLCYTLHYTVMSNTYGLAKKAIAIAVRVLDANVSNDHCACNTVVKGCMQATERALIKLLLSRDICTTTTPSIREDLGELR